MTTVGTWEAHESRPGDSARQRMSKMDPSKPAVRKPRSIEEGIFPEAFSVLLIWRLEGILSIAFGLNGVPKNGLYKSEAAWVLPKVIPSESALVTLKGPRT